MSFNGFRSAEQAEYAWLITQALNPGPPMLAGAAPGLGKTHGYAIPLVRACAGGLRVAIAFPTRQLIEQFLRSQALADALRGYMATVRVLLPRPAFGPDEHDEYRAHVQEALGAEVLLLTHAAAMIDSMCPTYADLRSRDVVLFDEADLLADAGDLFRTFTLSSHVMEEHARGQTDPRSVVERILALEDAVEPEERAAAKAILRALDRPAWYKRVGFDADGALHLRHRMPGRTLIPLVRDLPRAVFTSGTMMISGTFRYFARSLGILDIDVQSRHIDPANHGRLHVEVAIRPMTATEKAQRIAQAQRPVLVLTTSHADCSELAEHLGATPGVVVRAPQESLADAVARCPDNGILLAAGAWAGLDDPRLRWKTVAIPRAPYGPPTVLDGGFLTSYADSRVVAIRRTSQGLHRGLRTADAECTLLLLDVRSARLMLREAIPARFRVDWSRCERDDDDEDQKDEKGAEKSAPSGSSRFGHAREAAFAFHEAPCEAFSGAGSASTGVTLERPGTSEAPETVGFHQDSAPTLRGDAPAMQSLTGPDPRALSDIERNASVRQRVLVHHGARCQWPGCKVAAAPALEIHDARVDASKAASRPRPEDFMVLCQKHHIQTHERAAVRQVLSVTKGGFVHQNQ
jgi:hypothetical protein